MGNCDSALNYNTQKKKFIKKNSGGPRFRAPINDNTKNDFTRNENTISQMTIDISKNKDNINKKKPNIYKYINSYNTNGNQNSLINGTLVELGQGNSLMYNKTKKSFINKTSNSIYTNNFDETGNMSSYDGVEMIADGKIDEDKIVKSKDQTTIYNYNEFIRKKNSDLPKAKIIDYYIEDKMDIEK